MRVVHILAGEREGPSQPGPELWSAADEGHSPGSSVEGLRLRNTGPAGPRKGSGTSQARLDAFLDQGHRKKGTQIPRGGWKVKAKEGPFCGMARSTIV